MKTLLAAVSTIAGLAVAAPAFAALPVGATAPDFTAKTTTGGKHAEFNLKRALKKGPVVLFFYPAAFTKGCTIEAHLFAEAADEYHKAGATLVGVSTDKLDKLDAFSTQDCQSKFPLASDADKSITKAYDTVLTIRPDLADRTSYVIAPNGKVALSFTEMQPNEHVEKTLAVVKSLTRK